MLNSLSKIIGKLPHNIVYLFSVGASYFFPIENELKWFFDFTSQPPLFDSIDYMPNSPCVMPPTILAKRLGDYLIVSFFIDGPAICLDAEFLAKLPHLGKYVTPLGTIPVSVLLILTSPRGTSSSVEVRKAIRLSEKVRSNVLKTCSIVRQSPQVVAEHLFIEIPE